MLKKYTSQNITWIDVIKPTQDEVRNLMLQYKLHPLVAEELLLPTFKPKVDLHENYIYLILHFPFLKRNGSRSEFISKEIDFIIGKDFIITIRYDEISPLETFSKIFEVESILNSEENQQLHAGYLFYYITQKLYEALLDELDHVEQEQREMEKYIFSGKEKIMVREISRMGHNLLDFKQATMHHKEVLDSLELVGESFFGKDFIHYLRSVNDKYRKVYHLVKTSQENLKELRETNDSLLTTKQNETMKIFTILAFVTFPLSLLASIFGMNTIHTPVVGWNQDFWWIVGGMILSTTVMFSFFKYKKWF
ncbi:magnesium transporter CorA family protein [Patescibacteria group bacterium]|nr:magnesium transporter CorA family protein [Patescibacteria group bacterium]